MCLTFFIFDMFTQRKEEKEIRTSNFCVVKRGSQLIELPLMDG